MEEAFEKLKERLEEESKFAVSLLNGKTDRYVVGVCDTNKKAINIVSEVEAEYINKSTEHINKLRDCSTNGDKIRAMSDEELADLTLQHDDEYGYFYCSDGTSYQDYGNGYEEALKHEIEWLKSPTTD